MKSEHFYFQAKFSGSQKPGNNRGGCSTRPQKPSR